MRSMRAVWGMTRARSGGEARRLVGIMRVEA